MSDQPEDSRQADSLEAEVAELLEEVDRKAEAVEARLGNDEEVNELLNEVGVDPEPDMSELDVDVEVRMTKRNGRWRAYDMVAAGISAVLLYRAQFETHLLQHSPEHLIDTLRQRMLEQG